MGVSEAQSASNIEVGRYSLSADDGSVSDISDHFSGDNHLMAVGISKSDAVSGRGLAASPAVATAKPLMMI